jgi:hypothetical protein
MTDGTSNPYDLDRLGDALERAAARSLTPATRRRVRRVALVAALAAAIGTGAAAASGAFSGDDVARGMPAGSAMFGGTKPSCVLDGDGITYHCTLSQLPSEEVLDNYLDTKELVTLDGRIAGGCIGMSADGRTWDCYLGDEAVKQGILVHDLLGQRSYGPGHG